MTSTDVVTRYRLQTGTSGNQDVITRFRLKGAGVGSKDVITRFRIRATTAVTFDAGFAPPLKTNFNPFESIPLTIAASLTPDTVTVAQTAGPSTLTITGSGQDWRSTAPARLTAGTYTVRVTATKAGYTTVTKDYTFTVAAHGGFYRKNGTGIQIRMREYGLPQTISSVLLVRGTSSMSVTASVTNPTAAYYSNTYRNTY